jgi:hypothetical protein
MSNKEFPTPKWELSVESWKLSIGCWSFDFRSAPEKLLRHDLAKQLGIVFPPEIAALDRKRASTEDEGGSLVSSRACLNACPGPP